MKKNEYTSEAEQILKSGDAGESAEVADFRNLVHGNPIPTIGYCDQPYVIDTDDGAWLLTVTTGSSHEGMKGEIVVTMRSTDFGKTWTDRCELEPPDGVEAAYSVFLKTPFGRIYCFYNHNTDDIRSVETAHSGTYYRVDSLGHFVFRYSDDHGKTWSKKRYEVPQEDFEIDLNNYHKGRLKYFWNVGKAFILDGKGYVPLHKIGEFGFPGGFVSSEGVLLVSENILTEVDPEKLVWKTLPDGKVGIRAPEGAGKVAEEQSFVTLSDGSIYCSYRTVSGYAATAISRDGGHTFSKPDYMRYPDGKRVKNPRARNCIWSCKNGTYIYWFHNNSSKGYANRNPVWVLLGEEGDTPEGKTILWSQPEILFYDDDILYLIGYPDMIEANGGYYFTETQKFIARTHYVSDDFFANMRGQFGEKKCAEGECFIGKAGESEFPVMDNFYKRDPGKTAGGWIPQRNGFSVILEYENLQEGEVLFDTRNEEGKGICIIFRNRNFELRMSDGVTQCLCDTVEKFIYPEKGHLCFVADGGPNVMYFVYDGQFCDGGLQREHGWQRFSPKFASPNGADTVKIGQGVKFCRVFNRALTVSECVKDAAYKAGR